MSRAQGHVQIMHTDGAECYLQTYTAYTNQGG